MAKSREESLQYIDSWTKENTDRIVIKSRKSDDLPGRIQKAIDAGVSSSRQAFIIEAVRDRLEKEGF